MGQGLHPVADTQDGQPTFENKGWYLWSVRLVNGSRPTGEDKTFRRIAERLVSWGIPWIKFAVDLKFSDAACDQLGVLGPEINNSD